MAAASYLISSPVENYWGGAQREKLWAKCEERKHFSPIFSLAVFWAMPQLAERLEEAIMFQLFSDPSHFQVVDSIF